MGRVALVTGVADDLGAHVACALASDPAYDEVIGVDITTPTFDLGAVEFVHLDIRQPAIAKVIAGSRVDTVVHISVSPQPVFMGRGSRSSAKERNVIGSMQLLAACQRAPGIERFVMKSSGEVYGSTARDPSMFTEDMSAKVPPAHGFAKDMVEVEGYVRGFARRRPDVTVTTLRNANSVGPTVRSAFTDFLRLPVIPKVLGYDARIQVTHHDDLVDCLHHAAAAGVSGIFNVAGHGVMTLSQVIRRLGRPEVPLPSFALSGLGSALAAGRFIAEGFSSEQIGYLRYGRALETTRLRDVLGFTPRYSTEQAIEDFKATLAPGLLEDHPVAKLERALAGGRRG